MSGYVYCNFTHCFEQYIIYLNICIISSKERWSLYSAVNFTSSCLQNGHPGFRTSFHLYIMLCVPHKPDTYFTTQSWKILGTLVIMCPKTDQYTRSKLWVCRTLLSYIEDLISLWLIFFLMISPTESVTLLSAILQIVVSWVRHGGVGSLFCTLDNKSDLDLMSHSIF